MDEPRQRTSRKWIAVAFFAMLLAYPLSFGPACWIAARTGPVTRECLTFAYAPLLQAYPYCPYIIQKSMLGYANFGVGPNRVEIYGNLLVFWEMVDGGTSQSHITVISN